MKKIYILILLVFASKLALSQYNITSNNGQTITSCNAYFSDNISGKYSPNLNNVFTFKANTPNSGLRLIFSQFDIHFSDTLYIYDGPNITAPLIGKFNNSNSLSGGQNLIQSGIFNITNATGASITFKFVSDTINQGNGWLANINCTPICQKIIPKIDSLSTLPHPVTVNNINACSGQNITLSGKAVFPENNIIYHQSASASVFQWNFGDGTTASGQTVNHTYNYLSDYEIKLKVTDSIGCQSNYLLVSKLRIAPNPIANINPLNPMCTNEAQLIKAGYDLNSNVVIKPFSFLTGSKNSFDSLMFIPDGPNCQPGVYTASLSVNNFPNGANIQSASDIKAICINIEHSFAGDLGFKIVCPNNQFVQLDSNSHSGGNYLGEPFGGNNHHSYDNNGCFYQNNPAGTNWSYCWSEIYPNNNTTLDQLSSGTGSGTILVSGNRTIDSTNQQNHTNYIKPQNPFNGLIGCPLNGVWIIEIRDDYATDNGYISHWDIQLQNNASQLSWTYNVNIDSVKITGPFSTIVSDSSLLITPTISGNFNYQVHIKDDFGCAWDTTLALLVVQKPNVNLGSDTSICYGDSLILNATNPGANYIWQTPNGNLNSQNITTYFIDNINSITSTYIVNVKYSNPANTFSCSSTDTIFITTNPKPIISFVLTPFPAEGCEPLEVQFDDFTIPNNVSYLWSFGDGSTSVLQNPFHNFFAGVYGISLKCTTLQGCSSSIFLPNMIKAFPSPFAEFVWNPLYATPNNPVNITNLTSSATSYNWNFGDGSSSILQNPTHTYTQLGSYTITLIALNSNTCSDTVSHIISVSNIGITDYPSLNPIIYVDNINNTLHISNIIKKFVVDIYDISGRFLINKSVENKILIDISSFAKGIYIVKLQTDKETLQSKFVKE